MKAKEKTHDRRDHSLQRLYLGKVLGAERWPGEPHESRLQLNLYHIQKEYKKKKEKKKKRRRKITGQREKTLLSLALFYLSV
jgi:hypothetical protein